MDRRNHVSGQTGITGSNPVLTTKHIALEKIWFEPRRSWCRHHGSQQVRWMTNVFFIVRWWNSCHTNLEGELTSSP